MSTQFHKAVIERENRGCLAQRARLKAAVLRPVLWLWVIGSGMQILAGTEYTTHLLPGIVGMSLLFSGAGNSFAAAAAHPLRSVLVNTLSATLGALVQMGMLIALLLGFEGLYALLFPWGLDLQKVLPWVGRAFSPQLHILLPAALLAALNCAAMGILCGRFIKTVVFPVFFLSGALYPITHMPELIKWIAQLNPFSYSVDLLRHGLAGQAEFEIMFSVMVLLGSTVAMSGLAAWRVRNKVNFE